MKALLTTALVTILIISCQKKNEDTPITDQPVSRPAVAVSAEREMCFLKVLKRDSIKLSYTREGDSISGTFNWLPYEKDKKFSTFKGRISGNTAYTIGKTMAEGNIYKEELIFTLTDTSAAVKFGEMREGDDGTWMYKNKSTASEQVLSKIACP